MRKPDPNTVAPGDCYGCNNPIDEHRLWSVPGTHYHAQCIPDADAKPRIARPPICGHASETLRDRWRDGG
jgi:hypothetical protein